MPTPVFDNTALSGMSDSDLSERLYIAAMRRQVWDVNPLTGVAAAVPWYLDPLPSKDRQRIRDILWPEQSLPFIPRTCGNAPTGTEESSGDAALAREELGKYFGLTQGGSETNRAFCERMFRVVDPA